MRQRAQEGELGGRGRRAGGERGPSPTLAQLERTLDPTCPRRRIANLGTSTSAHIHDISLDKPGPFPRGIKKEEHKREGHRNCHWRNDAHYTYIGCVSEDERRCARRIQFRRLHAC